MSSKKKRNKRYKGSDATAPISVVKVSAVKRNPAHQWWVDHRRLARPTLITVLVIIGLIIIIVGIIDIFK